MNNQKNKAIEQRLKNNVNFARVSDFLFQNRPQRPDGTRVDDYINIEYDETIWDHTTGERLLKPILYWKD